MEAELMERFRKKFHPDYVSAGAYAESNDILLFVHIPKAAGMSLGEALRNSVDAFHGVDWRKPGKSFIAATKKACYYRTRNDLRQVIMGHYGSEQLNYWRKNHLPIKAASLIRDPLTRFVSNYNYNRSNKHPARHDFVEKFPTMLEYAKDLPYDFQLTTLIGPFFSFEHALEKLLRDYTFLGVVEHMNTSIEHLKKSHGLAGLREHRINKTELDPEIAQQVGDVREIVLEKSANDLRLHRLLDEFFHRDLEQHERRTTSETALPEVNQG